MAFFISTRTTLEPPLKSNDRRIAKLVLACQREYCSLINLSEKASSSRLPPNTSRPEMFCFGLLEAFDTERVMALVTPRSVMKVMGGG